MKEMSPKPPQTSAEPGCITPPETSETPRENYRPRNRFPLRRQRRQQRRRPS